ncbi:MULTISPECIES: PilZ domain-containing protein [Dyella]|uniref:PilZ domain-containing protein n=2 Tax=Dyella TaxID=231454 RepID=A0A4R0YNY9_9GAMM|nr:MULTISPECIES: PilZ domain-containing protein [Dyella]TBR37195.1 PilZ domain-containing protein [Dyella terrae]TCI07715.1 PilZ domain-containing protein [Dyella soli]
MNTPSLDDFNQLLACDGDWLVEADSLAGEPDERVLAGYADRNVSALTFMDVFESRRAEPADEEDPLAVEIARMDAKLNALIQIVNRMLVPDATTRTRMALRFNALGALVPSVVLPGSDYVVLRIRMDACPSLPLELPARVAQRFADGNDFVGFLGVTEGLREGLERMVFRHHRRRVAVARQGQASQA